MQIPLLDRLPRHLLGLVAVIALGAAACGTSETVAGPAVEAPAATTAAPTTTEPPTTEAAPTTTEAVTTTEAEPATTVARDDEDVAVDPNTPEGAAMIAWSTVFDSTLAFDLKAPHLENAEALEASNAAYAAAGETMNGIALQATAATIDGDIATITYDVYFGANPAYTALEGEALLTNGVWMVSEASYCDFLGSARTPCQT